MTPLSALLLAALAQEAGAPLQFERIQLTAAFLCEGATFGDLDRDGHGDVVAGPYWYAGPDFATRRAVYPAKAFDPAGYSDSFFAWTRDLDGDGWLDVLYVGFPGEQAWWCENPGADAVHDDAPWSRHPVLEGVDNESPAFADLTGDGLPELVCQQAGAFGWAAPDADDPRAPWRFHPISRDLGLQRFTHGLGVGDLSGDGRADVLWKDGWFEQPASLEGDSEWTQHAVDFCAGRRGGAQMLVDDVDGDGDADVVTSLDAHGWGLSWFEQTAAGGARAFVEHRLMDSPEEPFEHGACFAELHALDQADVDGDGRLDFVTGKRWWSHGLKGDPETTAGAALFAFLKRDGPDGARFEPVRVDHTSGVGTQVVAGDVDGDGRCDVVVGNKKGGFVLLQRPVGDGAPPAGGGNLDLERGTLAGWTATGDAFEGQPVRGDTVWLRGRREGSRHQGEWWVGGYELHGDGRTGTLSSAPFELTAPFVSFLVAGGSSERTRVELVRADDGAVLFQSSGADHESLQRVVADLTEHAGERIFVRLVDEHAGGWGHVNFDDLRLHATRPDVARDPDLPRIPERGAVEHAGLAPADAARAMSVPEGFHVDLIAAEPDLHQPVALAIDHRGRIWVAEARSYPQRRPEGEGLDSILVFEDADHDGSFETRTVFAEGLNLVSGLEVGHGGAWVGAAPELLFIPDRDGDLVPDGAPEVVLDGWGYQDTHETLNAFTWGPDGWLYGCHGVFTHSKVGAPGTPDAERVPLNAGVWRYHPTRRAFEVFAWGTSNPWGIAFDAEGEAFITACVIPHLWHVLPGARYQRQGGSHFNPHVYEDLETIADHRHYAGSIGDHAWWGRDEPVHYADTQAAGGGHAHCGALIVHNTVWPAEYRGALLVGNVHGNRFNRERLERAGSGFVGRHAPDFLLANDEWFRGINLKEGPDGAVYFIDWYDQRACHRTDAEGWDRTNGRLYRVRYGELAPAGVAVDALGQEALLDALFGADPWLARHALQVLHERGLEDPDALVLAAVRSGDDSTRLRLQLLWASHALGLFGDGAFAQGLKSAADGHDAVTAWTVRLALEDGEANLSLRRELERLARESASPRVRRELASGLQRLPRARRWELAAALAARGEDDGDANIPLLLWYGVEPLVAYDPPRALALARESRISTLRRFVPRRAAHEPAAHDALVAELAGAEGDWLRALLAETARALGEQRVDALPAGWPELYARLAQDADPAVRDPAFSIAVAFGDRAVFPALRATLADPGADTARRERALDDLLRGRDPELVPALIALLDEDALRARAIRGLARFESVEATEALLARYAALSEAERRDARATLAARAGSAHALLDAVEAGRLARAELDPLTLRALDALGDAELSARLAASFALVRPTPEEQRAEIAAWRAKLAPEALAAADLPRGRAVYEKTCAQCHALFGAGGDVGPDLTGSNRADLDYLLETVVDPNALIPTEYQVTLVRYEDGRVASGIVRRETEDTLTLVNQTEEVVVWKDELEERVPQTISIMPEGQLAALTEDEVRDLIAYVAGPTQVPKRATPADAAALFDGQTLAGWSGDPAVWRVEDGAIVGHTEVGLERNAFLFSELELGDFRLSLEVKLTPDAANSGIQFHSRAVEGGEARGPQADVGAGWWGKLYEEQGRGLLWSASGAAHVRPGEWNRYEIEATGSRVRTWINGQPCVDLDDPELARRGVLALQVHSGGPTDVRFRDLRLELDPEPRPTPAETSEEGAPR